MYSEEGVEYVQCLECEYWFPQDWMTDEDGHRKYEKMQFCGDTCYKIFSN